MCDNQTEKKKERGKESEEMALYIGAANLYKEILKKILTCEQSCCDSWTMD